MSSLPTNPKYVGRSALTIGAALVTTKEPALASAVAVAVTALCGMVLGSAVLSGRKYRRDAAYAVLKLLLDRRTVQVKQRSGDGVGAGRDG
jgi:hypothetical protein